MQRWQRRARIASEFLTNDDRHVLADSERMLLGRIFRARRITQGELTDAVPLSQQSVSRMVQSLELRGLILKDGRQVSGQRGQPSAILTINPTYAYTMGVSIMADSLTLLLLDFAGGAVDVVTPKLPDLTREAIVRAISEGLETLIKKAGIHRRRVFGVGVAVTGFRVGAGATFNTPPSLEALALVDLEDLFSGSLDLPVWAENDGKAATVGENLNGVGRRFENFAYYFIATGVGGGIIVDGRLLRGSRGNAGEFVGVLPIGTYASPNLEGLRRRLEEEGVAVSSVAQLVANYNDDWPGIDRWIAEVAPSLSLMASATAATLDTEAIVLGGLMPTLLAQRLIPHIQFFDINRREVMREHAAIIPAECEGDATMMGAALLPLVGEFFQI